MKAFQQLTINLTEKEKADYERYGKSWGEDWVSKALDHRRARIWIALNLNHVNLERKRPYNCYNTGKDEYSRVDGEPLTQDDIDAVKFLDNGQMNKFTVSDDGMTIIHAWECDSGD
jgi:hypothetical protein